jgi:hypothetical protein
MRVNECAFEMEIVHAARGRDLEDWMATHLASCPFCADAVAVDRMLHRISEHAAAEAAIPEPSLLWLKAQFLQRRVAGEEALRPLALLQRARLFGVAAGWGALLIFEWPAVSGLLSKDGSGMLSALVSGGGPSMTTIAIAGALLCATAVVAVQSVLAED